jgi:hypothetical protein
MPKLMLGLILAVGAAVVVGGCFERTLEEASPPAANSPEATAFHDRLLQIAREYESYGRVDDAPRLVNFACGVPIQPRQPGQPPDPAGSRLRMSAGGKGAPHARKLYYMFAKQSWACRGAAGLLCSYVSFPGTTSPVGQAIVKESWVPEEVSPESNSPGKTQKGVPHQVVEQNGRSYRAARKGELFIMYKLDPSTPGTDNGWVYGTVSADGKQILASGRIESCMKCHQDAPHDRLFGLPEEQAQARSQRIPWPKDWSKYLGQTVTVEGNAANAKLGALLLGDGKEIWINGLDSWPEGFYSGGDRGKRVRVTGTVIQRDDLPVFVQKPGGPLIQGIPVQSEEEKQRAKWRYLLRDAKWTVLD